MTVLEWARSLGPAERADGYNVTLGATHRSLMDDILGWDEHGVWQRDGLSGLAEWLALRFDITLYRARRWIACAHRLQELPLVGRALETGALGLDKVVELTRFATTEDEAKLIHWAQRNAVSDVKARADEATAAPLEDVQQVELSRNVAYGRSIDGLQMDLYASFPVYEGEVIKRAIEEFAERLKPTPEDVTIAGLDEKADTLGQRRADAFFQLITGNAEGLGLSPSLVVHAELDVVTGERSSGALEDGPVLHPAVVQQIVCDARLQTVLEERGTALGIGHESRQVPYWVARQVKRRDRHCVFPGCNEARFLQLHHVTPWPHGPTEVTNLVCLCWRHHKLIHLFRWRVSLGTQGSIEWYRPDGERFAPGPAPPT